MVTKKRIWFPNAIYHITNRGNHKEIIFREEIDYIVYLNLLKNTLEFYKKNCYEILCYCLMTNHVHLLIKTGDKDPSFFMRRVNSMYVTYFNAKYEYVGHLFQSRYFSNLINTDEELLEVSKYIHLNPVKATIVTKPQDYKWSSFKDLITTGHCRFANTLSIIDYFKSKDSYKKFVEDKREENASEAHP